MNGRGKIEYKVSNGFNVIILIAVMTSVKITVTSDQAQTIEISVYGGKTQKVHFNTGETKVIEFNR